MQKGKKLSIWFVLHVLFFIFVIFGVFWIKWYYLFLIFLILRIQDFILGGCFLTKLEYGSFDRRFIKEHSGHLLPKWSQKIFYPFVDFILPIILIILAYLIQS